MYSKHDDNLELGQAAQPSYTSASGNVGKGHTVLDPRTSDIPLRDINAPVSSAQPVDPNSNFNTMRPTMDYAPPTQSQSQQNIASQVPFGETSVSIQCPVCNERTVTKTKYVAGGYTYGWALCLCAVTGLGCIPFCVGKLKNVEHRCGNCDERLAIWHRYNQRVGILA